MATPTPRRSLRLKSRPHQPYATCSLDSAADVGGSHSKTKSTKHPNDYEKSILDFDSAIETYAKFKASKGSARMDKELERWQFRVQLSYCHYCNNNERAMPIQLNEERIKRLKKAGHPLKKPGFMRRANGY